ncbi:hypothetical protein [Bradyrhizobium sp. RDM4]|uniref:hypothetical protein n=1 Tax=Bradyrhizobium sp. RDM4 TaxID=3378765 RepID=UPI0038FCE7F5
MSYLLMATALAEDLRVRGIANVRLADAEAMVARMLDRSGELARRLTQYQADGSYDGALERVRDAMRERGTPVAPGPEPRP